VTNGLILLRIDSREARERQAQAGAALESANAEAVKLEKDLERYKTLFATQSVAKKELEDVQARHDMAKAAQQRATAALEEAATQVSYSDVIAPFDGIVSDRFVNKGDHVAPGKPLFNVYDPSSLELVAQAGEQYAAYLKEGATVTVKVQSIGLDQKSTIREVVPQRDERSRTISVKAPLPGGVTCAPGLYGTLTFDANVSESLSIPWTAVKMVGQLETVRVLDGDRTTVRQIKTGRRVGDKVEVVSGLSPGEQVVVE
jgi:RND family efflux transporter MFP subunit